MEPQMHADEHRCVADEDSEICVYLRPSAVSAKRFLGGVQG